MSAAKLGLWGGNLGEFKSALLCGFAWTWFKWMQESERSRASAFEEHLLPHPCVYLDRFVSAVRMGRLSRITKQGISQFAMVKKKMNDQVKSYCHLLNSTITATERTSDH